MQLVPSHIETKSLEAERIDVLQVLQSSHFGSQTFGTSIITWELLVGVAKWISISSKNLSMEILPKVSNSAQNNVVDVFMKTKTSVVRMHVDV